jgi:hypothetical protein
MNHSCNPNVSARHPDRRTALSRITVIAERDVAVGEELIVTYVDPSLGVCERRSQLVAWGFGQCYCERCVKEEMEGRSCGDEGEGEIKSDRIWTTWRESSRQDWAYVIAIRLRAVSPSHFIEITTMGAQWWWLTPMRCCITNAVGCSVVTIWRQRGQRQRPTTPVCQETFLGYCQCVLCGAFKGQPGWPSPQRTYVRQVFIRMPGKPITANRNDSLY